jgi:hypothetical protein
MSGILACLILPVTFPQTYRPKILRSHGVQCVHGQEDGNRLHVSVVVSWKVRLVEEA